MDEQLITLSDLARELRVPVRWLRTEADEGRLPHVRAEKQILFDVAAVKSVLLKRARRVSGGDHE